MYDLKLTGIFGNEITLESVKKELASADISGGINVILNSKGGDLLEAKRISEYLASLQVPLQTTAIMVGSAATYVFFKIEERYLSDLAGKDWLFIHNAAIDPKGLAANKNLSAEDMRAMAALIDSANSELAKLYADCLGITTQQALAYMAAETWVSEADAEKAGILAEFQILALLTPAIQMNILEQLKALADKVTGVETSLKAAMPDPTEQPADPAMGDGSEGESSTIIIEDLKKQLKAAQDMCAELQAKCKALEDASTAANAAVAQATETMAAIKAELTDLQTKDLQIVAQMGGGAAAEAVPYEKMSVVQKRLYLAKQTKA